MSAKESDKSEKKDRRTERKHLFLYCKVYCNLLVWMEPVLQSLPLLTQHIQSLNNRHHVEFIFLVTCKIVRVKIWYLGIYNQDNLVHDGFKIDQDM